jgi:hypothetical protein
MLQWFLMDQKIVNPLGDAMDQQSTELLSWWPSLDPPAVCFALY